MKDLLVLAVGTVPLLTTGVSFAQSGNMMSGTWGGDWMGGHGGIWMPILMVIVAIVVVALVVWIVKQKK